MSEVSIERQAELAITLDDAVDKRIRDTVLRVFQGKKDTALDIAIANAVERQVRKVITDKYKELESEMIIRVGMQVGKAIAGMTPQQAHAELWEDNPYADLIPDESLDVSQQFGFGAPVKAEDEETQILNAGV